MSRDVRWIHIACQRRFDLVDSSCRFESLVPYNTPEMDIVLSFGRSQHNKISVLRGFEMPTQHHILYRSGLSAFLGIAISELTRRSIKVIGQDSSSNMQGNLWIVQSTFQTLHEELFYSNEFRMQLLPRRTLLYNFSNLSTDARIFIPDHCRWLFSTQLYPIRFPPSLPTS